MALDPVPWFVGGGALHPAEAARLLAYAATSGAAGVVASGDLAITQLPTAGTSVRAAVGGAVIPNLYPGGGQQSYIARATSATDIPVTATGSGSGRVDLVVARIDDPQYGGTVPADVTVGPYVRIAIIENVTAGSTDIPAGLAYPAIALARLDIPASTATITTAMITPLAKLADRPRVGASVNLADSWSTQATRTHAGTWNIGQNTGGFVGALTANTAPIVIPAGKGGLYAVSLGFANSATMSGNGSFIQINIGGTLLAGSQSAYRVAMPIGTSQGGISLTLPLAAGCSLTIISGLTSAAYGVTATLSCYRIGD